MSKIICKNNVKDLKDRCIKRFETSHQLLFNPQKIFNYIHCKVTVKCKNAKHAFDSGS